MSFFEITLNPSIQQEIGWALAIIIGFPVFLLALGEVAERWRRRGSAFEVPARHARLLVLPTLAVFLFLTRVVGLDLANLYSRLTLTALLLGVLYAVLSLVKAAIFARSVENKWQRQIPRILTDLIRLSLVLIGSMFVLSAVWGHDLGQMLTALGVGSIVIGLALQQPLGNVFSGIFLLVEHPVEVGDWIEIDGKAGKITEINWRAVQIVTRELELVVIPNSVLAQGQFKNFSRPQALLSQVVEIGFSYHDPPNKVKQVLEGMVRRVPGVLLDPAPVVQTLGYGDFSVRYGIRYYVSEYAKQFEMRDELMTRIWYASKRHGLTIPYPISTEIQATPEQMSAKDRQWTIEELKEPLQGLGLSNHELVTEKLEHIALRSFGRGEMVVREGEALAGLHLIVSGQAAMLLDNQSGAPREICRLNEGEFFGERAIFSRKPSEVTVQALEDLQILILDADTLKSALEATPRLAVEIGNIIEARAREFRRARQGQDDLRAA